MSILKKVGITLGTLAIIGGGSLAAITASANSSRMFDTNAVQYITSGDLAGYKSYLIGQESTRINNIDQAKFDKIKSNYTVQKPLLDLQAKYEPQLITMASNKDQAGFVSLFKQFQAESKPVMESLRAAHEAEETTKSATSSASTYRQNHRNDMVNKPVMTDEQLTNMANRQYTNAVNDIAAGRTYKIGFGKRGGMAMKHGYFGSKSKSDSSAPVVNSSIN